MSVSTRTVVTGALSYLPGAMPLYKALAFRANPAPPEASYGIWLKHLAVSQPCRSGGVPRRVVELGPGLSMGVGLAALICGAERYVGLDVMRFVPLDTVVPAFDRLVDMFRQRERPRNANGFPSYESLLDARGFPSASLPPEHMAQALEPARIAGLRAEVEDFVRSGGRESARIGYIAPWDFAQLDSRGEADFLLSHTVLQHVQSPAETWAHVAGLLRPGGTFSHQINFDCHGTSPVWNGHWAYPEALWRVALGRKVFLINRAPLSVHVDAATHNGLGVEKVLQLPDTTGLRRYELARHWQGLSDNDLTTRGAVLIGRKR